MCKNEYTCLYQHRVKEYAGAVTVTDQCLSLVIFHFGASLDAPIIIAKYIRVFYSPTMLDVHKADIHKLNLINVAQPVAPKS